MRLGEIAARLGCRLEGPEELEIDGVAGMDEAGPGELTFLANPKYLRKINTTCAAAIIASPDEDLGGRPALRSSNPYLTFAKALELFHAPHRPPTGIHPTAVMAPDVKLGRNPSIGPYVVLEEGVEIGDDCVLKSHVVVYRGASIGHRFFAHSHAVVREFVRIGDDVTLQNGAAIGTDGYGFARQDDGSYHKIVQTGTVVIEDNVEIQAYACIDRAAMGETRIHRGAKIDNLVQVGHGCEVGENSLLCGQVGLAGTTKLGRNVILTGQVGIAGHVTIGDNVVVSAQSGIHSDVEPNRIMSGSPAIDNAQWMKCVAAYARLPQMFATYRKVRELLEKSSPTGKAESSRQ
jgi:UDP-3-O-[3-hydroxymyristoyl] glucosamine N-acyltransferase